MFGTWNVYGETCQTLAKAFEIARTSVNLNSEAKAILRAFYGSLDTKVIVTALISLQNGSPLKVTFDYINYDTETYKVTIQKVQYGIIGRISQTDGLKFFVRPLI